MPGSELPYQLCINTKWQEAIAVIESLMSIETGGPTWVKVESFNVNV